MIRRGALQARQLTVDTELTAHQRRIFIAMPAVTSAAR